MSDYQFFIPNKKRATYQVFSYGILFLNIAGLYIQQQAQDARGAVFYALCAIVVLLSALRNYRAYKKGKATGSNGLFLLVFGLLWVRTDYTYFVWINLLLAALYMISVRKLRIDVSEQGVSYPSFPPKDISWEQISNLVLKDDILTIDQHNNKIYQHLVAYPDKAVNEAEFNEFCKSRQMADHSNH